jgi:hypothetical protein
MLTERELNKIFSWLPYRDTWTVDKTKPERCYGDLVSDFTNNEYFETLYSQDGGMTNYLEFICYPIQHNGGKMNAVIVCVSLCAPIACYGQTSIYYTDSRSIGHDFLEVYNVSVVVDKKLMPIEKEIKKLLHKYKLSIIDKDFAGKELPSEVVENMENLNEGTKYLHGLFQWAD